jgi:hypothetical protein
MSLDAVAKSGAGTGMGGSAQEKASNPVTHSTNELSRIIQGFNPTDSGASSLRDRPLRDTTNSLEEDISLFDAKDSITLQEIRNLKTADRNFSRPIKAFKLDLSNSNITDAEFQEILKDFPKITEINAKNCRSLTSDGLQYLAGLDDLTSLNLAGCGKVTDAALLPLSILTKLTSLSLEMCGQITDVGLHYLANLTALNHLNLTGCSPITDAGLRPLLNLTALNYLNLTGCSLITDEFNQSQQTQPVRMCQHHRSRAAAAPRSFNKTHTPQPVWMPSDH